jgi:hypothetical protein
MNPQVHSRPAPRISGIKLTTTAQTTIYTAAGNNMNEVVEWVHIANTTASPATVTIEWTDSSAATTYTLIGGQNVPANVAIRLELGVGLPPGDALKATAGTANALQIVIAAAEMGRSS